MRISMVAILTISILTINHGMAQMQNRLEADPDMPRKPGFDIHRAIFWSGPNFMPLRNPEWLSLDAFLRVGVIDKDTPVVHFSAGGKTLVLVSAQMAYHHIAQGDMNGEAWMVTF